MGEVLVKRNSSGVIDADFPALLSKERRAEKRSMIYTPIDPLHKRFHAPI
jgi:hypothetical protein